MQPEAFIDKLMDVIDPELHRQPRHNQHTTERYRAYDAAKRVFAMLTAEENREIWLDLLSKPTESIADTKIATESGKGQYRIRCWAEVLVQDHTDYLVEAVTLEEAAVKVSILQNLAQQRGDFVIGHSSNGVRRILQNGATRLSTPYLKPDMDDVIHDELGYSQLNEAGEVIRHLVHVPILETQIGDFLAIDWHPEVT